VCTDFFLASTGTALTAPLGEGYFRMRLRPVLVESESVWKKASHEEGHATEMSEIFGKFEVCRKSIGLRDAVITNSLRVVAALNNQQDTGSFVEEYEESVDLLRSHYAKHGCGKLDESDLSYRT
jgi:hypothetical protein